MTTTGALDDQSTTVQSKKYFLLSMTLLAWLVGAVFVWAGLNKLVQLQDVIVTGTSPSNGWLVPTQELAKAIRNYRILTPLLSRLLAVVLPWIEIFAGAALISRRLRYEGALVVGGMLVMFVVAVARALIAQLDISCGCFSISTRARRLGVDTLFLDIALLAVVAITVLWLERERRERNRRSQSA